MVLDYVHRVRVGVKVAEKSTKSTSNLRTCLTYLPRTTTYFEAKNYHVGVQIIEAIVGRQMASVSLALSWLSEPTLPLDRL
jgi:hypothetical protein